MPAPSARPPFVRPEWLDDALYPFESRTIEIDGHRIHYVDEGSGPTLVFVHGNPTWSFVYREVIAELRTSFRCIAVDLAGFGLSDAAPGFSYLPIDHSAVLAKTISALDLSDYTIVVQDWGGPVGLSAAIEASGRVSGVVISNTWGWPVNGNKDFEQFSALMGGPLGRFGSRFFNAFVNILIPASFKRRKPTRAEMVHYRKPLPRGRRMGTWVFPKQIIESREFLSALERGLPAFSTVPVLLIWGDKDDAFQTPELERWQQLFPAATTVVAPGVGHYAPSEAPAEFASAIRNWKSGA